MYGWLAASVAGVIFMLEHVPFARPWLDSLAAYEPTEQPSLLIVNYVLLPFVILFVPGLVMGLGFSLSQQLLQTRFARLGRRLGRMRFVNVLGCVAGAIITTQVVIPWVGTSGGLKAVALVGLGYAFTSWREAVSERWKPIALGALLVISVAAVPTQDHLWAPAGGPDGRGDSVLSRGRVRRVEHPRAAWRMARGRRAWSLRSRRSQHRHAAAR